MPNVPQQPELKKRWLSFTEAAELLGVDQRTIKRWMTSPDTRSALLAVRDGKRWRILRPHNDVLWEIQTRKRLEMFGIKPKKSWVRDLYRVSAECDRCLFAAYQLWLAARLKALERGRVIGKTNEGALLLWQRACELLDCLPKFEMDPQCLKKSDFPSEVQRYWPGEMHFAQVRGARTLRDLESLREKADFIEAVRALRRRGSPPIARNLRPLLHKDFQAHINDTGEKLSGAVIATSSEAIELALGDPSLSSLCSTSALPIVDLRQPQDGISDYQFRQRYSLKKDPWASIIAAVYQHRGSTRPTGIEDDLLQ